MWIVFTFFFTQIRWDFGWDREKEGHLFYEFRGCGKKQGNEVFNLIALGELLDCGCHASWSPISDFS